MLHKDISCITVSGDDIKRYEGLFSKLKISFKEFMKREMMLSSSSSSSHSPSMYSVCTDREDDGFDGYITVENDDDGFDEYVTVENDTELLEVKRREVVLDESILQICDVKFTGNIKGNYTGCYITQCMFTDVRIAKKSMENCFFISNSFDKTNFGEGNIEKSKFFFNKLIKDCSNVPLSLFPSNLDVFKSN